MTINMLWNVVWLYISCCNYCI